jgi:predicted NBD/HSP70 family sugar kinase
MGCGSDLSQSNATNSLVRKLNLVRIIDQIRAHGEMSRAELMETVGLSRQTVSAAVAQLIVAGLVSERPGAPGGQGRRPKLLSLSGAGGKVAAVQVEVHRLRVITANLAGELEMHPDTQVQRGPTVDSIATVLEELTPLRMVTIAIPGVRDPQDGSIQLAPTVPTLEGHLLERELTERLGVPVSVENDVNLAAVGESWHGTAQQVADVAFLWLGPGVGLGAIVGGEILRGARGRAGEIGFMVVEPSADGHGTVGLFERCVSESAVLAAGARAAQAGGTGLATVERLHVETIFRLAELGDPKAKQIEVDLVERVAAAATAVLSICDPQVLVLGGSVTEAGGERFVRRVRECVGGRTPAEFSIKLTSLGYAAALHGGVAIALSEARRRLISEMKERRK